MTSEPLVSVIVVNFNGLNWLHGCLSSLTRQSFRSFEIIFVDNGSTDESVSFVQKNFPKIKLVKSKLNLGFAGGNNLGLKYSVGKYLLLLNNDTKVERDFVEKFVKGFDEFPNAGIIQSKIVWMNDPQKIDTCGSYWTNSSFMYYVGNNKNTSLSIYNSPFQAFGVKGASCLIKRELIEKVGFLDSDFWNYYEETDFCHRAWIAGYECWYYPKPVCYHAIGGTSLTFDNDVIQFHNFKNKLSSFLTNFEMQNLLIILPTFLLLNLLLSITWLLQGKIRHSTALFKALEWNIRNFNRTLKKRRKVQLSRKIWDIDYLSKVKKNPRLSYYYYLFSDNLGLYND